MVVFNSNRHNLTLKFRLFYKALSIQKRERSLSSPGKTENISSREHVLDSKADKDKIKLAFLNLLGGWKEND
jgi:hypothetical protein